MNLQETAAVVAMFSTNWPNYEITEHTVNLWASACRDLDPNHALEGAKDIICQDVWFPSIARLRDAVEVHAHAARNKAAEARGLPEGRPGWIQPPAKLLEDLRAYLAKTGAKKHWHAGPDRCPVCGGLQPDPKRAPRGGIP